MEVVADGFGLGLPASGQVFEDDVFVVVEVKGGPGSFSLIIRTKTVPDTFSLLSFPSQLCPGNFPKAVCE